MNRHCRQQEQKGQSTVEYAGAAFVVAAIIATIATLIAAGSGVSLAQAVVCKISSAIHSVGGADDSYSCDYSQNQGQEANDPRKVDPGSIPSQSEERMASTSVGVSIPLPGPGSANVGGKDGTSVTKTTYMDNSGTRQYSSTQEGSAGYEVGASTDDKGGSKDKGKGNPFSAKVNASAGVSVSHTTSETYNCDTPDHISCEEFDKQNEENTENHLNNQGLGRIGNGGTKFEQTPDSTSTVWNAKLKLEASASASLDVKPKAGGSDNKKDEDQKDDKDEQGEESDNQKGVPVGQLKASASLNISGEAGYTYTTTTDASGKTSSSHKFTYTGSIGGSVEGSAEDPTKSFGLKAAADASGSYTGSYEVTYDENGDLSKITFTNVKVGQGSWSATGLKEDDGADHPQTSTITTTLDVSSMSDNDKKIAQEYVDSSFTNGALIVPQSVLNPDSPSDNSFENLLYERAQVTRVVQDGTVTNEEGGWGPFKKNSGTDSKNTVSAQQLSQPSNGGRRTFENM